MAEKDPAFALRLKSVMDQRQLTQAKAASLCGVTVTALQNYLGGRLPQPTQARTLAKGLDVQLSWLLEGIGDQQTLTPGVAERSASASATQQSAFIEPLNFAAIEMVLGRPLEEAAPTFGATADEVLAWKAGAEPPLEKLARLTNLILFVATDGRLQIQIPPSMLPGAPATDLSSDHLAAGSQSQAA